MHSECSGGSFCAKVERRNAEVRILPMCQSFETHNGGCECYRTCVSYDQVNAKNIAIKQSYFV
jgi:hypothetical protein